MWATGVEGRPRTGEGVGPNRARSDLLHVIHRSSIISIARGKVLGSELGLTGNPVREEEANSVLGREGVHEDGPQNRHTVREEARVSASFFQYVADMTVQKITTTTKRNAGSAIGSAAVWGIQHGTRRTPNDIVDASEEGPKPWTMSCGWLLSCT